MKTFKEFTEETQEEIPAVQLPQNTQLKKPKTNVKMNKKEYPGMVDLNKLNNN